MITSEIKCSTNDIIFYSDVEAILPLGLSHANCGFQLLLKNGHAIRLLDLSDAERSIQVRF